MPKFRNYDSIAPKSDRIFNTVALACSAAACALVLTLIILVFSLPERGVQTVFKIFVFMFFLDIGLILFAGFISVRELVRNPFPSSFISLTFALLSLICLILFTIFSYINYGYTLF